MPSSDFNLSFTWKQLLAEAEQLSKADFDNFFQGMLSIRANKRAPKLTEREAELLKKINAGVDEKVHKRADELRVVSKKRLLTEAENAEFFELIEVMENFDAVRVQLLGELAQLRNVPVRELMAQLEIQPAFDA